MTKKHLVPISRAVTLPSLPSGFTILDLMAFMLSLITMLSPVVLYKDQGNR